ncbi:DUF3892 domain-containing protein [Sphingomonas edaphi]|uniref:DUF3892 domain-containing protein n=1 Tax=Sphingomonas edaphi TaxID=2315689 RepID=A0A418Q2T5_9SPHN|nr:DUF3892 domain-containing protein [Sphingomonas edaphi]RIX32265.1 DUF3892 domain-containing protein [Sphingomonas edaphi]
MAAYPVKCHTPDNLDLDRRIQGLGGDWGWKPIDRIIQMIEGGDLFWVSVGGRGVAIIVKSRNGRKYLTTFGDDHPPNNLLSLPKCPSP